MESKLRLHSTKVFTFVGLFFLYATSVFAVNGGITEKSVSPSATAFLAPSVIVSDNFAGSTPTYVSPYQSPNFTGATGLSANGIAVGIGVTTVSTSGSYSSYGWNGGDLAAAQTNNDYYEWVITPQAGKEIDFNQLVLQITRGNNGNSPKNFVLLASTAANFGSPVSLGALSVANNASSATLTYNDVTAFASFQNVKTAITFRLYSFGGGTGSGHTFNVVSYAFTGEVFDLPTFGSVSQEAVVCEGTPTATIVLSGLLPNSVSTVSYTIGGGPVQVATGVVADGSGTTDFPVVLVLANDSQTLTITSIVRTDLIGVSPLTPNTNNTVVLGIDPLLTWYLDADTDGYYTGEPVLSCDSPGIGYTLTVTAGGDCNDTNAAVNPGASEVCFDNIDNDCDGSLYNGCAPVVVNLTNSYPNNLVLGSIATTIISTVPAVGFGNTITEYIFEVTNLATNEIVEFYSPINKFNLVQTGIHAFDTDFSIRVRVKVNQEEQSYAGTSRIVKTPTLSIPSMLGTQCATVLSNIRTVIFANSVNLGVSYEFTITSSSFTDPNFTQQVITRPVNRFSLLMMPNYTPAYNTSYSITVRVQVEQNNGELIWSPPSPICVITTPSITATQVVASQCDNTLSSLNTTITGVGVSFANAYTFKVSKVNEPTLEEEVVVLGEPLFRLNMLTTIAATEGTSYNIWVKPGIIIGETEIWGQYAAIPCIVSTPITQQARPSEESEQINETVFAKVQEFKVLAYPNPFRDVFTLDVKTSATAPIQLVVYDMTGRLLENKTLTLDQANNTSIGANYPKGVYNVVVTQGEEVKMIRVVKQ